MPQTLYSIAKTHKDVILQKFLDDSLGNTTLGARPIVYQGRTVGNTPTELFMDGKLHTGTNNVRRLYLPESSFMMFEAYVLGYNATDNAVQHAAKYYGGVSNLAGTVAALKDFDGTAGGTNVAVIDPNLTGTTGPVPIATGLNIANGSTSVAFTADDTNDALVITVTGTAAKTIAWKVYLLPYLITQTGDRFYGDQAAGNGI